MSATKTVEPEKVEEFIPVEQVQAVQKKAIRKAVRKKSLERAKGLVSKKKQVVMIEYYGRNRGKSYFWMDRPVGETGVDIEGKHHTVDEGDIYLDDLDDTFRIPLVEDLARPPRATDEDPRFSPEMVHMRESGKATKDFVQASDEGLVWRDFLFGLASGGLIAYIAATIMSGAIG